MARRFVRRASSLSAMVAAVVQLAAGCGIRYAVPSERSRDARFGWLGGSGPIPDRRQLCRRWEDVVGERDAHATRHVSYPETDRASSCFTEVRYRDGRIAVGPTPASCAFPAHDQRAQLASLGRRLASGHASPGLFPCRLPAATLRSVRSHNARVLSRLSVSTRRHPYAAIVVPGHGNRFQGATTLVDWAPGDRCRLPARGDLAALGEMVQRASRAADAYRAGVAPIVLVSGGAVHSRLVEAFALYYLLTCFLGIPRDAVLLEPCAQHTHTNLRNAARWLVPMGARAAYLVTSDGLQADYFQDYGGFELVFGSIDQRSLRDWGYVIGSWRQAARGTGGVGFWFTPFRFWADTRRGLRDVSCVDAR